jgi:hypothetical protein
MIVAIKVLISVMVGAIAAGVLYTVGLQYQQPAHLKTGIKSTDYNAMKSRANYFYIAKVVAVVALAVSSLMLLWYSWYWSIELAVVVVGVLALWQSSFRLTQLEHTLYDLKRS